MSEKVMVLGKVEKGTSSVQGYESAWLGRWTQLGINGESSSSKGLIKPEDNVNDERVQVSPFPMFKAYQKKDPLLGTNYENAGSSSNVVDSNRLPWVYAQGDNRIGFPMQEKTTQNFLELIRPVRIYATVDSVKLPEEDGQQLLKGSTVSMKLKGKLFGGYLDLFPNQDQCRKVGGGVRLQSLERSEDGPSKNESTAETDTLEMDRLQTISSSTTKGKGRQGDLVMARTEIPDMNEEPPLVPDRRNLVDRSQGESSNSATQSMNMEHFLSRERKRVELEEAEPSSRWVKRLKTNTTLDYSGNDETKSLMNTEQGNNNNLFLEILKSGINNHQTRNQIGSQTKDMNEGEHITLKHPWIQRWCKKKGTSTDQPGGGQEVSYEPENQREFEKKQYPSIAAMALMGKALTGLNPLGRRKTNSLMVWNAQDLR